MVNLDTKRLLFMQLVLICWPVMTFGQQRNSFDTNEWLYGKVYLETGDSLSGGVMYYPMQDVVQVAGDNGVITSFSPVNVSYFIVNGVYSGKPQLFRSLMWDMGKHEDFKKPVFFEQVNEGALKLLKRYHGVSVVRSESNSSEAYPNLFYPHIAGDSDELLESFYVMLPDGQILPLRKKRKELNMLFGEKSDLVKKFVKKNRLDYEIPHHLVAIVNYFNLLFEADAKKESEGLKIAETNK